MQKYHELYVQSDNLLLADVSERYQNVFFEMYKLDLAHLFQHQYQHGK